MMFTPLQTYVIADNMIFTRNRQHYTRYTFFGRNEHIKSLTLCSLSLFVEHLV